MQIMPTGKNRMMYIVNIFNRHKAYREISNIDKMIEIESEARGDGFEELSNSLAELRDLYMEPVLDWLDQMDDRQGLSMSLAEMERMLQNAPDAVRQTEKYHYLRGLHDGRFLHEELRSAPLPD